MRTMVHLHLPQVHWEIILHFGLLNRRILILLYLRKTSAVPLEDDFDILVPRPDMAEAEDSSSSIKHRVEVYLKATHELELDDLPLLKPGFCVIWYDKHGKKHEARFNAFGMTDIIHARELLDGNHRSFVNIAAIMNKNWFNTEHNLNRFTAQACAFTYLKALDERRSGEPLTLTKTQDWNPDDKPNAKEKIKSTLMAAWVHPSNVDDEDQANPEKK